MDDEQILDAIEKTMENQREFDKLVADTATDVYSQSNVESVEPQAPVIQIQVKRENKIMGKNVGLDVGTMNLVAAKLGSESKVDTTSLRNVFLEIDKEHLGTTDLSFVSHTTIDDRVFILSEDAYNFANIFNRQVSRPMQKGMISAGEMDGIDVLNIMIGSLVGKAEGDGSICCYSIPAEPVDADKSVIYHENVFSRILSQLGYKPVSLNEAVAIVYSECSDTDFSGVSISFGAGMTNIAVVYKSIPVLTFSIARGGDWIDENTAQAIGWIPNRVTQIKEKPDFEIDNFNIGNKREKRAREALSYYYKTLVHYATSNITTQLNKLTVDLPTELPIVVSGGTSKAKGFLTVVSDILSNYDFPFSISGVKSANNPLTAVAEGCLIRSLKGK